MLKEKSKLRSEHSGAAAGVAISARHYARILRFQGERAHGIAAEYANHLWDWFMLRLPKHVGYNNVPKGPDRLVSGVEIQSKYCSSGAKCIQECFADREFCYWSKTDPTRPMRIEVPPEFLDDAVKSMAHKIRSGQLRGITDPKQARQIVQAGHVSHAQARALAKAGSVEGLVYDSASGSIVALGAFTVSFLCALAYAQWSGQNRKSALKSALYTGTKIGGLAWLSSIVSAQAGRTAVDASLRSSSSWFACGATRGTLISGAISTVVLSVPDFYEFYKHRVTGFEVVRNLTVRGASLAGSIAGFGVGTRAGEQLGNHLPRFGKAAKIIFGILGMIAGGAMAESATKAAFEATKQEKKLVQAVRRAAAALSVRHVFTEREGSILAERISNLKLTHLQEIQASSDEEFCAIRIIEPIICDLTAKRPRIPVPSMKELDMTSRELFMELAATSGARESVESGPV